MGCARVGHTQSNRPNRSRTHLVRQKQSISRATAQRRPNFRVGTGSCAESLASENASRLAAMQRAGKNIDQLLADLNSDYHQLRQSTIDEELFDVISGFEALK